MEETGRNGAEMERTLVWGHRGASGYAPENTMAAFEKAVEMGADGIELDVQLTKDGELVVIHDETIDRVSDGSGWVKDYTYAKLIKHNFNRTHPEYEHAQIPTLEETPMRKKNLERIKITICITKISTFLILCDLAVCLATLYVSFSLVFALMRYLQGKVFLIRFYSPTTLSSSRAEFRLPSRLACA